MSFQPVVPLGGAPGWALLQRTEDRQREVFDARPDVSREAARFAELIPTAATAEDLVSDRRLLRVALTAFGLEDEIDKRALIQRALESDPSDPQSFANRLVDRRYRDLASAFGYGSLLGPKILDPGFADTITDAYRERRFELAVGESNPDLRLALNARRELARLARTSGVEENGWFAVLGDRPLRAVVEGALGLPEAFAQVDVDRQRDTLEERMQAAFGASSPKAFEDPDVLDDFINRFLIRAEAAAGPTFATPGAAALSLLSFGLGPAASQSLILSGAAP
ncbi:MAG: DUF1217 domain-containing protein [Pseudomonadota bacterium]